MASIKKIGDKYVVRYREPDGTQRTRSFVRYHDAKDLQAAVENGNAPTVSKQTLGQYLQAWQASFGAPPLVRPNTAADYKNCIEKHIIPALGKTKLVNLSKAQVQQFYNELATTPTKRGKPLSAKTIKNIHCTFAQAMEQAIADGLLKVNPTRKTKRPKVVKRATEPPAKEKMNELLKRVDAHRLSAAIWTCALLGVRRGEALGATWSALDLKNLRLLVNHQLTPNNLTGQLDFTEILKTDASYRYVPVPALLKKKILAVKKQKAADKIALGSAYTDSDFIFTDKLGLPIKPDAVSRAFKLCAKSVGLPSMRLHGLRGAYATYLIDQGVSPKTVQDLLGHATADFTMQVYAASLAKSREETANIADSMYGDF